MDSYFRIRKDGEIVRSLGVFSSKTAAAEVIGILLQKDKSNPAMSDAPIYTVEEFNPEVQCQCSPSSLDDWDEWEDRVWDLIRSLVIQQSWEPEQAVDYAIRIALAFRQQYGPDVTKQLRENKA